MYKPRLESNETTASWVPRLRLSLCNSSTYCTTGSEQEHLDVETSLAAKAQPGNPCPDNDDWLRDKNLFSFKGCQLVRSTTSARRT